MVDGPRAAAAVMRQNVESDAVAQWRATDHFAVGLLTLSLRDCLSWSRPLPRVPHELVDSCSFSASTRSRKREYEAVMCS